MTSKITTLIRLYSAASAKVGVAVTRSNSIFSTPAYLLLDELPSKHKLDLETVVAVLGDSAYVGTFRDASTSELKSAKVIAKKKACQSKMEDSLIQVSMTT
jgi:hypothetical protein